MHSIHRIKSITASAQAHAGASPWVDITFTGGFRGEESCTLTLFFDDPRDLRGPLLAQAINQLPAYRDPEEVDKLDPIVEHLESAGVVERIDSPVEGVQVYQFTSKLDKGDS